MDPARLLTARALMQVNYEARTAVLSGRHLQNILHTSSYTMYAGYGDTSYLKFFFVNWDIDMFFFQGGTQHFIHLLFDRNVLSKIKHIAMGINGPRQEGNVLRAPGYYSLIHGAFGDPTSFARSHLPSAKTMHLVLHHESTMRPMTAFMMLPMAHPEGDVDDDSDRTHFDTLTRLCSFRRELESIEANLDLDLRLPEDKFGFHHFELESPTYTQKPIYYPSWRESHHMWVKASFKDWVNEIVSCAREGLGRSIEIRMVTKHTDSFDPVIAARSCINRALNINMLTLNSLSTDLGGLGE
ncbi:hypothetical protein F5Y09DRAFT_347878 [Xylaria sp. FL1042]|nr:hypothetical protein F5Y09DRAFT_347878 [Xylaria sp. FL1042]